MDFIMCRFISRCSHLIKFQTSLDLSVNYQKIKKQSFVGNVVSFLLQAVSLKSSEILDHTSTQVSCNNHVANVVFFWKPRK